ncbi:hypothetical protein HOL21_01415 [Candidatus Woesearchaeota archaeon]|jgi:hypothetical protein|nr:hypothetical protein [Candidatus Woesearchaeota archaeon]MBT5396850.1 hypothetical protein [Candidatus Woesearchaeota archaeon]MBT5924545.1 hypothetical protein [Candidatus Woesearchaeota archaeon]MBT6367738.1 hypothetical protein [Candidatus Woesearchaeota archaeon]MBT7762861.1 hypothetical protein [Candidatus Woesearchaeota archaeon]
MKLEQRREVVANIARSLENAGYRTADPAGYSTKALDHSGIGILGVKEGRQFFHIGTLWMNNESRGATRDERWVLEVFGDDYRPHLEDITAPFRTQYDVTIDTTIKDQQPRPEKRLRY